MIPQRFTVRQKGWHWYVFTDQACASEAYASRDDAEAEAEALQVEDEAHEAVAVQVDLIFRAVSRLYDADKPPSAPRNFAVREVLDTIATMLPLERKAA